MPVLAAIRERFESRAAARRLPDRRVPARDDRDGEPDAHAQGRRRRRRPLRVEPALDPGRRRRRARRRVRHLDVFAIKGEDNDTYYQHIEAAVDHKPHITMDDGADVIGVLHTARREQLGDVIAGTEETTTGVIRLKALEARRQARASRSSPSTRRRRSTSSTTATAPGQSTIDGIIRATNVLLAGKRFVVAGYGWCRPRRRDARQGHGRARRSSPRSTRCRRSRPLMDGFEVHADGRRPPRSATSSCTATGDKSRDRDASTWRR